MSLDQAALRAKRKERVAQYETEGQLPAAEGFAAVVSEESTEIKASASEAQKGTTQTDGGQPYADESAPAPETESAGQQLIAEVTSMDNISSDAQVDMVLFQYDEENPAWAVFASGQPVAEIRLSDQPNPADLRPLFESLTYAETVKKGCAKDGIKHTLTEMVAARPYVAALDRSEVVANLRAELEEAQKDSLRQKQADASNDLMNALGLVLTAMDKGVMIESNPLKEELYRALASVGVARPVQMVEAAFEKAGPSFFEAALAQAQEWVGYSPEAYKQVEASVQKAHRYIPAEAAVNQIPSSPQTERQAAFPELPVNVPLETKTANTQPQDAKTALKQRLGLRK